MPYFQVTNIYRYTETVTVEAETKADALVAVLNGECGEAERNEDDALYDSTAREVERPSDD